MLKAAVDTKVVASIPAVHSLVSLVMSRVNEPILLMRQVGSPHGAGMRPSDIRLLAQSHIIFWIGPNLESRLPRVIQNVATSSRSVVLSELPGIIRRHPTNIDDDDDRCDPRERVACEHGEDKYDVYDPHIWLDPENARVMVAAIAEVLVEYDPANTDRYRRNADRADVLLVRLISEIRRILRPADRVPLVVYHDAYSHFASRFGLHLARVIMAQGHEAELGARHISELYDFIRQAGAVCVFSEPYFADSQHVVRQLTQRTLAKTGVLDPVGGDLESGPQLYFHLLRGLASSVQGCVQSYNR